MVSIKRVKACIALGIVLCTYHLLSKLYLNILMIQVIISWTLLSFELQSCISNCLLSIFSFTFLCSLKHKSKNQTPHSTSRWSFMLCIYDLSVDINNQNFSYQILRNTLINILKLKVANYVIGILGRIVAASCHTFNIFGFLTCKLFHLTQRALTKHVSKRTLLMPSRNSETQ